MCKGKCHSLGFLYCLNPVNRFQTKIIICKSRSSISEEPFLFCNLLLMRQNKKNSLKGSGKHPRLLFLTQRKLTVRTAAKQKSL